MPLSVEQLTKGINSAAMEREDDNGGIDPQILTIVSGGRHVKLEAANVLRATKHKRERILKYAQVACNTRKISQRPPDLLSRH